MKTTKEQIAVMQAFVDGKKIRLIRYGEQGCVENPAWNWETADYEVIEEKSDGELFYEAQSGMKDWERIVAHEFYENAAARFLEARAKRESGE